MKAAEALRKLPPLTFAWLSNRGSGFCWSCAKATEIQSYADSNNTKNFYDAFKQEYSPGYTLGSDAIVIYWKKMT